MPLTELKNGESGVITSTECFSRGHSVRMHGARRTWKKNPLMVTRCLKRLTDLGLTPGTNVTLVKSAPFKGPVEICVRGSRLAIGRGMASRILVEVER